MHTNGCADKITNFINPSQYTRCNTPLNNLQINTVYINKSTTSLYDKIANIVYT